MAIEFTKFKCKNCKQTLFMMITPAQIKYNLQNLKPLMLPEHMIFTCPLCEEPNTLHRQTFADELRVICKKLNELDIRQG